MAPTARPSNALWRPRHGPRYDQDARPQGRRHRLDDLQPAGEAQRRLLRDVGRDPQDHRRLRGRSGRPRHRADGRRRQGVRIRRRHLGVRQEARPRRDDRDLRQGGIDGAIGDRQREQADHRHDPRPVRRRRRRDHAQHRYPHLRPRQLLRGAGGAARPRLSGVRDQAAGRYRRAGVRQGDLLHGEPVHGRGRAHHGSRQPRRAGRGTRGLRSQICSNHRRQCADDDQGRQARDPRRDPGSPTSATRPRSTRRSTPASPARTTSKAVAPSWRSAAPPSRDGEEALRGRGASRCPSKRA